MVSVLPSGTTAAVFIPFRLILFREFAVSALRETTAGRVSLPVTLLAKWKTTLQMLALGAQLFGLVLRERYAVSNWLPMYISLADLLVWLAAIVTIWT